MRTLSILASFCAIAATTPAYADSFALLSHAEWVHIADVIVVGKASITGDSRSVRVNQVLKGPAMDSLDLVPLNLMLESRESIRENTDGVFMLICVEGGKFRPLYPGTIHRAGETERIKRVLAMFRDPAPFVGDMSVENTDNLIFVLGELFTSYRIESQDVLSLRPQMARFASPWYEELPWDIHESITVACTFDRTRTPQLAFEQEARARPLETVLQDRLRTACNWPEVADHLAARFSVTLDTRIPNQAGGLTAGGAAQYLRGKLTRSEPDLVRSTLKSLAKMRDLAAVPTVIGLLQHESSDIAVAAAGYLGWARDRRATPALRTLMMTPKGDRFRPELDAAAAALGRLEDPSALPDLQIAAGRDIENASYALGRYGDKDAFVALLEAAERAPTAHGPQMAMQWLVRRSNKPQETWMPTNPASGRTLAPKVPRWRAWWKANENDFQIVRPWAEMVPHLSAPMP